MALKKKGSAGANHFNGSLWNYLIEKKLGKKGGSFHGAPLIGNYNSSVTCSKNQPGI